ncbi:hypothetical protein T492DRAFT_886901, partial [Pavlovales sp. CCMP2436]
EQACRALDSITAGADAQRDARKQAAVAAGALPLVVAAMGAHAGNAGVQQWGQYALGHLQ